MSDPRVEKTKKKVLAAAQKLLLVHGFRGVTIEALSEESGVAKTTIYRHWEHAADVMTQAYSQIILQPITADTSTLGGDLQIILSTIAYKMFDKNWTTAVIGMMEASLTEPAMQDLHQQFMQQLQQPIVKALQSSEERGELKVGYDTVHMTNSLLGPVLHAGLITRQPIDPVRISEYVASVVSRLDRS